MGVGEIGAATAAGGAADSPRPLIGAGAGIADGDADADADGETGSGAAAGPNSRVFQARAVVTTLAGSGGPQPLTATTPIAAATTSVKTIGR